MKRKALAWTALLYPAKWRRRYGVEFAALLEQANGGWRDLADVAGGGLMMQMRMGLGWRFVAVCGLIGIAIAGVASWKAPKHYVSTAVVRFDARDPTRVGPLRNLQSINEMEQQALSRKTLSGIIEGAGLYKGERAEKPIEDIVNHMRTDIAVRPIPSQVNHGILFSISLAADDSAHAHQGAAALVDTFQQAAQKQGRGALEILDRPSYPSAPNASPAIRSIVFGALLGLLAGVLTLGVRRWPLVALAGILGAILAAAVVMLVPKHYASTALVMGASVNSAEIREAVSQAAAELRQNPDRRAVEARFRHDLSIRPVGISTETGLPPMPVTSITFVDTNAREAQAIVASVIAKVRARGVEVVDPASMPQEPLWPRAGGWIIWGLFGGLLCGVYAHWRRERKPSRGEFAIDVSH
jgi:hypothetical protein